MGDFNSPNVNWSTLSGNTCFSSHLCDLMFQFNLSQLVSSPTHIGGNTLDLVITNSDNLISSLTVHPHNHSSIVTDHYLIYFTVPLCSVKHKKVPSTFIYNFPKGDYLGMSNYLLSCDLSEFYTTTDIDKAWSTLKHHMDCSVDIFVPKVKLHSSLYPKWFNSKIRHQVNCLCTLRRKTKNHFTESNLQRLIHAEDTLLTLISKAKSDYETNLVTNYLQSKDPKIFHYIKDLTKSHSLPSCLHMDSTVFEQDLDKANAFNKYFHSVFLHSTYTLPDINELPSASDFLSDITVSSDEVYQALISLQPNKASGPDNIGPRILKNCAASLTSPLHHLFLLSLNSKTIPGDWKEHTIIPVFKSGDKSSLKNYRPISLLCSTSKVLESLIYNKVIKCIGKSISSHQFGFQKHKSTLQQLLLYFNDLCTSNNPTDTMYLDFTKAFDSVSHN